MPLLFVFLPIFRSRQLSIFCYHAPQTFFSLSAIQFQSHLQIFGVYYSYTHFLEPKSVLFPLAEHFLQSQDQSEKVCGLRDLLWDFKTWPWKIKSLFILSSGLLGYLCRLWASRLPVVSLCSLGKNEANTLRDRHGEWSSILSSRFWILSPLRSGPSHLTHLEVGKICSTSSQDWKEVARGTERHLEYLIFQKPKEKMTQ